MTIMFYKIMRFEGRCNKILPHKKTNYHTIRTVRCTINYLVFFRYKHRFIDTHTCPHVNN